MQEQEYHRMHELETTHWWFRAKAEYLRILLRHFVPKPTGKKAVDIGCGTGATLALLEQHGFAATGIDMSNIAAEYVRQKGLSVTIGQADHTTLSDNSVDVVTILDVLEHLDNDTAAVREIHRILKPGGMCIAMVPAHQFLWSYHDVALHHKRRYNYAAFQTLMNDAFVQIHMSWIHSVIFLPATAVRILLKKLRKKQQESSDVAPSSVVVNIVMNALYCVEQTWYRLVHWLPIGTSLVYVGKKK